MVPKIKMEIFKELRVNLKSIGVFEVNSSAKERNLAILRKCVVITSHVTYFVTTGWFRLFSAKSIREITESSYFTLGALLVFVWYLILIWQRHKYAALLDELETMIDQSEYDSNKSN